MTRVAPVLGDQLRRRRLPVRPRGHARPRRRRLRPSPPAARRDRGRSGAGRDEADRRAVGPRAWRLPRGRLPGPLRGVERRLPRRHPRRLARPRHDGRSGPRDRRLLRDVPAGARAAGRRVVRHRARRVHAPRPRVATTRSTTRRTARAIATATTTTGRWNSGAEGPTDDAAILEVRRRRAAGLLATLFTSQGVPMLLAGDERGRTQRGNNNAYCHDTPRTWVHWDESWLGELVPRLIALRASHPVLRRTTFLEGDHGDGSPVDVRWLGPDGQELGARGSRRRCGRCARSTTAATGRERRCSSRTTSPARRDGSCCRPAGSRSCSTPPTPAARVRSATRSSLDPWSVVILRDEA